MFVHTNCKAPSDGLLANLNEPQRRAVAHTDGPLLILAGPGSGKTRVVRFKGAYIRKETPDGALVEANFHFTGYSSWLLLLILIHVLLCIIVILVTQKKETKRIQKVLIRKNGRWYSADGAFSGPIDKIGETQWSRPNS